MSEPRGISGTNVDKLVIALGEMIQASSVSEPDEVVMALARCLEMHLSIVGDRSYRQTLIERVIDGLEKVAETPEGEDQERMQ